jgi:hypothetical protein
MCDEMDTATAAVPPGMEREEEMMADDGEADFAYGHTGWEEEEEEEYDEYYEYGDEYEFDDYAHEGYTYTYEGGEKPQEIWDMEGVYWDASHRFTERLFEAAAAKNTDGHRLFNHHLRWDRDGKVKLKSLGIYKDVARFVVNEAPWAVDRNLVHQLLLHITGRMISDKWHEGVWGRGTSKQTYSH